MSRSNKLTEKDMSTLREADNVKDQRDAGRGVLRDYGMNHEVIMEWDLNPEAIKDRMFRLRIDDKEVILDVEQVMRYLRWV
jgi:hypothetical protein